MSLTQVTDSMILHLFAWYKNKNALPHEALELLFEHFEKDAFEHTNHKYPELERLLCTTINANTRFIIIAIILFG